MSTSDQRSDVVWKVLLWIARLTGVAAIVPLMQILFGEWGTGPSGTLGWVYLALFPVGFSAGYLIAWRWPVVGGCLSLVCMVASLVVIGKNFGMSAYAIWGVLCIPGILFVIAGWKLRGARTKSPS